MYINPFVAGILATIVTEIVLVFIVAVTAAWRKISK